MNFKPTSRVFSGVSSASCQLARCHVSCGILVNFIDFGRRCCELLPLRHRFRDERARQSDGETRKRGNLRVGEWWTQQASFLRSARALRNHTPLSTLHDCTSTRHFTYDAREEVQAIPVISCASRFAVHRRRTAARGFAFVIHGAGNAVALRARAGEPEMQEGDRGRRRWRRRWSRCWVREQSAGGGQHGRSGQLQARIGGLGRHTAAVAVRLTAWHSHKSLLCYGCT